TIRPATERDLDAFVEVMTAAFRFRNTRPTVHTWAFGQPDAHVLVAEREGQIVATGARIGFGPTAWIGALAVRPEARGERLGTRMTEAAIEALGPRETLLLLASPLGRPIYEGMGFEPDGPYRVFFGPSHARPVAGDGIRAAGGGDRSSIFELDA